MLYATHHTSEAFKQHNYFECVCIGWSDAENIVYDKISSDDNISFSDICYQQNEPI